ncbi:MAG: LEPR-XLL domain-containing protein, partial [Burkholderiales bacterium]|nr:LEPR-XLL domain-containing protein [Burkholderiales bacterium]
MQLLRWFRNRSREGVPAPGSDAETSHASRAERQGKFRLETLEPRVLLSADSIVVSQVLRSLIDDQGNDGPGKDIAASIEQIDAATSAEISAVIRADSGGAQTPASPSVEWPASWRTDSADAADSASEAPAIDPQGLADSTPEIAADKNSQAAVFERAGTRRVIPQSIGLESDSPLPLADSQGSFASVADTTPLPRGPPANEASPCARVAEDSLQSNELSFSNSASQGEGGLSHVSNLLAAGKLGDEIEASPGADGALSGGVPAPILERAVRLWIASGLVENAAERLAGLTLDITDLSGAQVGVAAARQISLDSTAAGRGWFVDATPEDASEFAQTAAPYRVAAIPGGPAYGRMDLLTVLLHEVGHVLGLGNDSGRAIMAKSLSEGERISLEQRPETLVPGVAVVATATAQPDLDLVVPDIAAGALNDGRTITIAVAPNGDLTISGSGVSVGSAAGEGTGDDATGVSGITNIIGNAAATITIVGPDANAVWNLNSASGGSLAISGGPTITFSNVDVIAGGSAADQLTVDSAYGLPVQFDGGGGDDRLVIVSGTTTPVAFDGQDGFDAVVNQAGASGTPVYSGVDNFIDRPVLFIPGFGGTNADTSLPGDPLQHWFLTRGIDPAKLVLEPLANAYSDIVQTLVNTGYSDGTNRAGVDGTLYVSLWDWRVPVAVTADGADDGVLSDVTAASIRDWATDSFDSGLDYLAYWMDQAATHWQALTGAAANSVDIITHSTGGLVARSYLQSPAYDHPGDNLLPVNTLIQTGVPNQGTGAPFGMLGNDFSLKSATRALATMVDKAYELVKSGHPISNPDGTSISTAALPGEVEFIAHYIATLENLLAVYPFLDDLDDGIEVLAALDAASGGNDLLLDLNALGAAPFVGTAAATYVVYSAAVDTPDIAIRHTGVDPAFGAQNEILPFSSVIGRLPAPNEPWYEFKNNPTGGDGTVATNSARDGFAGLKNPDDSEVLFEIATAAAGSPVAHTDIVHNEYSQRQLLRLLGVEGYATAALSTGLLLDTKATARNLISLGLVDPVELATQAFSDGKALVSDLHDRIDTAWNQDLPLLGSSL